MFYKNKKSNPWKKEVKESDVFIDDPREGDLVIPVMGPTGAGKSTFINTLIGREVASVGHDLRSHTEQLHHYIIPDGNRRIIMVDTPGFDDTNDEDREILRRIAVWLARSYHAEMKLAGVIYMHEIIQTRMLGTARRNLDMFYKLCGSEAAENIILVTTKWNDVKAEVGVHREEQLRKEYWDGMLAHGSRMRRFEHTQKSAQGIVADVLARRALDAIHIQDELVMIDKLLAETDAGRTLRYTLKELLEIQKNMSAKLRGADGDAVRDQLMENDKKVRATLGQIRALNIPLSRKILRFLGF